MLVTSWQRWAERSDAVMREGDETPSPPRPLCHLPETLPAANKDLTGSSCFFSFSYYPPTPAPLSQNSRGWLRRERAHICNVIAAVGISSFFITCISEILTLVVKMTRAVIYGTDTGGFWLTLTCLGLRGTFEQENDLWLVLYDNQLLWWLKTTENDLSTSQENKLQSNKIRR